MNKAKEIIDKFGLKPHVEGGYYKETFKSDVNVQLPNNTIRRINSAIYYLLESGDFSCWHRIKYKEIFHYYCGSSITIYQIEDNGKLTSMILGNPLECENALPQYLIPPGIWFAAVVNEPNSFSLLGCTVSPGFDFKDFEIGKRRDLLNQFPQHEEIILQYSR